MEFFLELAPPTVTAQEHKVRVVRGKPMFYDTPKLKNARAAFESMLRQYIPPCPMEGPVALTVEWRFSTKTHKEGTYSITVDACDLNGKLSTEIFFVEVRK